MLLPCGSQASQLQEAGLQGGGAEGGGAALRDEVVPDQAWHGQTLDWQTRTHTHRHTHARAHTHTRAHTHQMEMAEAENEWVLRPYMNTAKKRKVLS